MRIALTVHKFPPESLGGTEVYTWGLARALARAGHDVNVFYPLADIPAGEARVTQEGVRLWRTPLAERAKEGAAAQFWHTFRDSAIEADYEAFLAETRPDIVHFQHVQGVSARLIALSAGWPRVVTLHDYWFFCANSQLVRPDQTLCGGPRGGWNCVDCGTARADLRPLRALRPVVALPFAYRNHYLARMAAQVNLFVAPSEFLRRQYIRHGFAPERMLTLENGMDLGRLAGPQITVPHDPQRLHFGFLGSLAWQKGVHVLVEAFNQLPVEARLTVYGGDQAFPEYATEVRALARHPGIRFAGPLDYRRVGEALRDLDCLVAPSLWFENSPLVIQEAYAVGLPVVASRLGALEEKVVEGRTGRLFAPGSPDDLARVLGELMARPEQLRILAANLPPVIGIDEHAAALVEQYRTLLSSAE